MKRCLFVVLLTFFACSVFAQKLEWAKLITGPYQGYPKGMVVDNNGYLYLTGMFEGTADFDPDSTTFNFSTASASNGGDVFIEKFDPAGRLVWVKFLYRQQFFNYVNVNGLAVDAVGDVYIVGDYNGTILSGLGVSSVLNSYGGYVLKISSSGSLAWVQQITGGCIPRAIAVNSLGYVHVTGTMGTTGNDYNWGTGVDSLDPVNGRVFVMKVDTAGNFMWAKNMGDEDGDYPRVLTADSIGNVYVSGYFRDTADFDPSPAIHRIIPTKRFENNTFVLKLDSSGNFVWGNAIGATSEVSSMAIGTDGNLYCSGSYAQYSIDFDPGPAVTTLSSGGGGFILKWTSSGDFEWVKKARPTIALDNKCNVYNTGTSIYMGKIDRNGNSIWADTLQPVDPPNNEGDYIVVDGNNNIYVTGTIWRNTDFDPDTSFYELTPSTNSADIFIFKWSQCSPVQALIDTFVTQGSLYTLPSGNSVGIAGIYVDTLQMIGGCDSIVTTNLSVISTVLSPYVEPVKLYGSVNQLSVSAGDLQIKAISIYSVEGKLMLREPESNAVNVSILISGLYIVEVQTFETTYRIKWAK